MKLKEIKYTGYKVTYFANDLVVAGLHETYVSYPDIATIYAYNKQIYIIRW